MKSIRSGILIFLAAFLASCGGGGGDDGGHGNTRSTAASPSLVGTPPSGGGGDAPPADGETHSTPMKAPAKVDPFIPPAPIRAFAYDYADDRGDVDYEVYGDWLEDQFLGVILIVDDLRGTVRIASPPWTGATTGTFRTFTYSGKVAGFDRSSGAYQTGGFSMTFNEADNGFSYRFTGPPELMDGEGTATNLKGINGWALQGAHLDHMGDGRKNQSFQGKFYGDGDVAVGSVISGQHDTNWGFDGMWRGDK